jgi:hypothetical protein
MNNMYITRVGTNHISWKEGVCMGLFGKKEIKNYIVFDRYEEKAVTACTTSDVKQILLVQPRAQFVECSQFEMFKFKEHEILPDDFYGRQRLEGKDVK